jgi:hypothetical protein
LKERKARKRESRGRESGEMLAGDAELEDGVLRSIESDEEDAWPESQEDFDQETEREGSFS